MFRPILNLIIVVLVVKLARTVRVYEDNEDDQEPVDITGNSNSTGPVVYPKLNTTEDTGMTQNETDDKKPDGPKMMKITTPLQQTTTRMPNMPNMQNNFTNVIGLRTDINNNQTMNQSAKVTENSSLKSHPSYLHQINTKPFVSSPVDIVARMAQQQKEYGVDSFQPMIEKPFIPSTPQLNFNRRPAKQQYETTPKSQIEEPVHSHTHLTSTRLHSEEQTYSDPDPNTYWRHHYQQKPRDSGRTFIFNQPQSKPHYPEEFNSVGPLADKRPDVKATGVTDYGLWKDILATEMNLQEEQPRYNSLQEYLEKTPQPSGVIAWPEVQSNDNYKPSTTPWTTEQPEFQTHPYKYHPSPTEYEPPKGFFSNALSFFSQSLKPSAPAHPYTFEPGTQHPKNLFSSNTEYHFPSSSDQSDGHKTYEKYEIITTSQPEYTFLSKPPSASGSYHGSEMMKPPFRHNLPWHKIIKVLSAIIPLGLLVSALTPNVVLIHPNATSLNDRPIGNIYSYVTRQRSLEPEDAFNEQMVKILDGLLANDQDPSKTCFKHAVCEALATDKTKSLLTREENMDFQNKICNSTEEVSTKCSPE